MDALHITVSMLPHDESVTFEDSSFFTNPNSPGKLPSPQEVRAAAVVANNPGRMTFRPQPVCFQALNLMVKYGCYITIAEGQCLWTIRHLLSDAVPVPEVYGWCRDGNETFIYMELIQGDTLEHRWDGLALEEKHDICSQLRRMVDSFRQLRQEPADQFIGSIGRQPLLDVVFEYIRSPAGPFLDVKSLHDWFVEFLPWRSRPHPPHPMRPGLCDDQSIKFTHGDLHRSNIIISSSRQRPPLIIAIIDWHQSGWYPAGWEWCKARLTAPEGGDWDVEYLPEFLKPPKDYNHHWDYFALALGV